MQEGSGTRQGATGEDPVARVDYQALVEDLPEPVCRLTPSLVLLYVNGAYCRYFGKGREEVIGRSIAQLLPGEDLTHLEEQLASLDPENPVGVIEHRVELPDGELRWHQWTIRAVYDGKRRLTEYQAVGRDVDARRMAVEALAKSEERFRSLIESVPDIVAVFDADGTIRYDNAALESTFGSRPGERVGSSNFDYIHPDDVELAKKTFAKAVENPGTQPPVRLRVRHADGTWRHVETVRTNLLDDPSVRGIMSIARDITEREEVERELRHQKAYSDALSEMAVGLMNRLETDELLNAIITRAASLVGTDHGFVNLVEPGENEMETRVGVGYFGNLVGDRLGLDVGLAGKVFQTGEPFMVEDYSTWPGRRRNVESEPVYALAGVPLGSGSRVVGVIGLAYMETERKFGSEEIGVLTRFAELASVALDNARLYESAQRELAERERTEIDLRESEERFRSLVRNAPDVITVNGLDGTIRYASPAIERVLGYRPDELIGSPAYDLTHPGDLERAKEAFAEALDRPGLGVPLEAYRIRHKDGSWRWIESVRTNLLDDPAVGGVVINSRDVTGRKEAEEALKDSEERFRAVIEQIIDGVYLGDVEDRRLIQSNAAFQQMLGYTAEELRGMEIYDFIAHDKEDIDAVYREILHEGYSFIGERQYRRKEGSVVDVETSATVISYGDKEMVCTVVRDITDRKEAEKALEESERRFRSMIQNASDVITILDADGTIRYESPAIERVQGYRPGERVGTKSWDYVHPEDLGTAKDAFDQILKDPDAHPVVEFRTRHKDGSWLRLEVIRTNLLDDPSVGGIVVNSRDVTERKEAEDQLRLRNKVVTASQNAILITDPGQPDNPIVYTNPAFEAATGYSAAEVMGRNCRFLQGSDPDQPALDEVRAALEEERECTVVLRNYKKDGTLFWNELNIYPAYDSDGHLTNYIGVQNDITERKQAEKDLEESEERYRAVVEKSAEAIYLHGIESKRVLESNVAFQKMLGYTAEELLGMEIYDFVAHDRADIDAKVRRNTVEEKRFVGERKYRHKDGALLDVSVSATLIPHQGGESVCVVVRDVTQSKVLEEQLRHRALHDSLTELPNRVLFLDRLEQALTRLGRTREALAVLFVDLDDFKLVNDSLGHDVGNDLLVEVAGRLRSCVRQEDTVARLFGDEFAVLLEAPAYVNDALRVTGRIMELLQKPCDLNGREVYANTSIGVALSDSTEDHPQDLLRRADLAMYAAKSHGKAKYEIFSPSMDTRALERLETENALRRAVENKEGFEVHYQPIVDLYSGEIVCLEALARWNRPGFGPVDTTEFIGLAESTGLIQSIGRWVLEEACQQARGWREQRPDRQPLLSVNFSASQFSRQTDLVSEVLKDVGLPPERLQLEITERSVMDNAEYSLGRLQRLKDLGVQFAIDDYGTGFSCLQYLKLMPVDSLKIDRSFVAGLGKNRGDAAIVAGTIDLAHALGLKVVAEGVETAEQLERLKELGCDMAQGFYLFRPGPAEAITELLNGTV